MASDAEKELTTAVNEALARYYEDSEEPTFIVDWMLITSEIDPRRDNSSGVGMFYQGGVMSWPTAFGLCEAARLRLQVGWTEGMTGD